MYGKEAEGEDSQCNGKTSKYLQNWDEEDANEKDESVEKGREIGSKKLEGEQKQTI